MKGCSARHRRHPATLSPQSPTKKVRSSMPPPQCLNTPAQPHSHAAGTQCGEVGGRAHGCIEGGGRGRAAMYSCCAVGWARPSCAHVCVRGVCAKWCRCIPSSPLAGPTRDTHGDGGDLFGGGGRAHALPAACLACARRPASHPQCAHHIVVCPSPMLPLRPLSPPPKYTPALRPSQAQQATHSSHHPHPATL